MRRFYLVGFRGVGKSTLGRAVASELGEDFADTDQMWEKRSGKSITDFVEHHGIWAWRREEENLLREIEAGEFPRWIATGGGIVEWQPSLEILKNSKREKIYLEISPSDAWKRLDHAPERRKIGNLRNLDALKDLLEKRRPLYEEISTHTLENRVITKTLEMLKKLAQRK
jgi:shikimate kinase